MLEQYPHNYWEQEIAVGDILLFRFPTTEVYPDCDAPKRRPCLVVKTGCYGTQNLVELAYGTSAYGFSNRGCEVIVRQSEGISKAGLTRPTRFTLNRRLIVSPAHSGFEFATHGDPRIGRLDQALTDRLHSLLARTLPEFDNAAIHHRTLWDEQCNLVHDSHAVVDRHCALLPSQVMVGGKE
ncbi:hypothetical protein [Roseivivax sp. CAU 1753]